ncbi:Mitosis inhibitor protein kinase wee1 [Ceratocystis lukuohia]|uniref:Mitosis inhibitor protein kinase wee1 n=1 Tax=Ceratocystis lukuohia TaxID=2019550 RepID=A0ABR4MU85_9PEZI
MSFTNGGGTLTLPSPTHPAHVDMSSAVRSLRRSLSRSPSKFNSPSSQATIDGSGNSVSASPQSPCRRYTPALSTPETPSLDSAPAADPSTTTRFNPHSSTTPTDSPTRKINRSPTRLFPLSSSVNFQPDAFDSTPLRNSLKISLRSTRSNRGLKASPSRVISKPRGSPKSAFPPRRALGLSESSQSGNLVLPTFAGFDASGQENAPATAPGSPLNATHNADKITRHSLHLDVTGNSSNLLKTLNPGVDLIPGLSIGQKRSDQMDIDSGNAGSPVAKRRSLHGIATSSPINSITATDNVFGGSSTPTKTSSFDIHEEAGKANYELSSLAMPPPREPITSSPNPTARQRSSLRRTTLRERTSWGRRAGAQQLSQMGGEFATPISRTRPRLSMDQFVPPQDSHFSPNVMLPPSTIVDRPQRHPLSRSLKPSESGGHLLDGSPTTFPEPFVPPKAKIPGLSFSKSVPYGLPNPMAPPPNPISMTPGSQSQSRQTPIMATPNQNPLRAKPRSFMSTSLISKVNRNPEDDRKIVVPDTPCKKQNHGFATYPPPPGSALKKSGRLSFSTEPGTPLSTDSLFGESASINFGTPNPRGLGLFQRLSRHSRRGSVLDRDIEDKQSSTPYKTGASTPESDVAGLDIELPPTPSRQPTSPPMNPSPQDSPSANRYSNPFSATRRFTRQVSSEVSGDVVGSPLTRRKNRLTALKLSSPSAGFLDVPRTPRESSLGPDGGRLSLSRSSANLNGETPATPTTGMRSQRVVTPVNPGQRLNRMELDDDLAKRFGRVDPIGTGEFSTVYRVAYPKEASTTPVGTPDFRSSLFRSTPRPPPPGSAFAVKKTRHPYHGTRDREIKLREARILAQLTHTSHIVRYIDSWEVEGHLYIQSEYCDNGTLDKFLASIGRQGRLDDFRIWKVLHDLTLGLQEIHTAGFIHLDLKPANIFITHDGVIKIGDFGLAAAWPVEKSINSEGDREYIGPEILEGKFDKPADVFSLGIIMIEMACNVVLPENGPTWVALRSGDLSDVPSLTFGSVNDLSQTSSAADLNSLDPSPSRHSVTSSDGEPIATGLPDFGTTVFPALEEPPSFMANEEDVFSLDYLVTAMINPNPASRPTVEQILSWEAMRWVVARRRMPATIYEGRWGPSLDTPAKLCQAEDTEMMDV